jgi:hypothetical protein
MFGKILKRNSKHKLFVQNFFFSKIVPFLDNVKKYCTTVQDTDNNKTWRMHVACLIPKATGTHSKHVICFSTTNLVAQTLLNISLYMHCLCLDFPVKVNVKVSPCSRPHGPRWGSRGIAPLFHDFGTRWGWVVIITPWPPLPPEKTQYPLYRRLGGPQGRSG